MVNIRVYLGTGVQNLEGFTARERTGGDGPAWKEYSLRGISLNQSMGRWYIQLENIDPLPSPELGESAPPFLAELVEEVSLRGALPRKPRRVLGIYRHRDATAALDVGSHGGWWVEIRGKSLESVAELYRLIRAGTILPAESWEAKQSRPSRIKALWKFFRKRKPLAV